MEAITESDGPMRLKDGCPSIHAELWGCFSMLLQPVAKSDSKSDLGIIYQETERRSLTADPLIYTPYRLFSQAKSVSASLDRS